jgi:hypothetical protein
MFTGLQQMNHQQVDDTLHPLDFVSGIFRNEVSPVKVLAEVTRRILGTFEPSLTETQLVITGGVVHNDWLPAKTFPIREGRIYLVTQADFPVSDTSPNAQFPRLPGPSKVTHRYVFVGPDEDAPVATDTTGRDKEIYVTQLAWVRPATKEERRQGARALVLDSQNQGGSFISGYTIPAMGMFYLKYIG